MTAPASDSTPHSNNTAVIRLRKQTEGQIVNGWLILIVILGAVIAVADGLTRPPYLESELSPPQPLQYEPYRAAFLLAGVTFPLMLAYGKRARVPQAETLFLWFVFCMTAYTKDFSYLRVPGAPFFVTDVVLIVLLISIYIVPGRNCLCRPLTLNISLAIFIGAGVLAALRGFLGHRETVLVLRDSALVVYSLFLLVAYHTFRTFLAIRRAAAWFALGAALNVLNGLAWFVVAPEQRRFVFPGIYVFISLVGVLVMMANRLIHSRVGWIFAGVFCLGLLLANARTLFVSFVVALLAASFVPGMFQRRLSSARLLTTLIICSALVCSFAFVFRHYGAGRDFTNQVADNMSSGILHTNDDPYWQYRLMAWKEAGRRFQEYPAAGEGFGNPFNFEVWDNDPRPHNTFLTVLYKMGLIGFLPLLAILACFFWFGLRAVHRNSTNRRVHFLQILILAQVSFCVWGGADAVLESPYMASLFWVGMGAGFRMIEEFNFVFPAQRTIPNPTAPST